MKCPRSQISATTEKQREQMRLYYQKNKKRILQQHAIYNEQHREERLQYFRDYNKSEKRRTARRTYYKRNLLRIRQQEAQRRKLRPWLFTLVNIRTRCTNPNRKSSSCYVGKGIRCFLSKEDVKELWERDRASTLAKPSIDRIDPKGHYTKENCRFIELAENSSRRKWKHLTN